MTSASPPARACDSKGKLLKVSNAIIAPFHRSARQCAVRRGTGIRAAGRYSNGGQSAVGIDAACRCDAPLVVGAHIVHKERVHTTPAGTAQLLFTDKSSMSIAPNTDIVIDEYVYDPNANNGHMWCR
jgi:hypothetical protein